MTTPVKYFLLLCMIVVCSACISNPFATLQCEYADNPIGIDALSPRFTWSYSDKSGFRQHDFQLSIATNSTALSSGNADFWASEKITGNQQRIAYTGAASLQSHQRYFWRVTSRDANGKSYQSPIRSFEMGKLSPNDWSAVWITDANDKEYEPAPLFRKGFNIDKKVEYATVSISGTAYYEMFLNGQRVGNSYLDPGYTHYDKRILYVTHDVTSLLNKGVNAAAVVLGNGFYNCQSKAVWDFERARWRNRPRLLCEINIRYTDGCSETIATDRSWKTNTGAYTYNNIYSGDKYDARLEEAGWNDKDFDDHRWSAATETEQPAPLLVAQQMPPIRIVREIKPTLLQSFGDTIHVFDLRENIAGLCRMQVKGESGTTFTIKHGELLKKNGRLEPGNIDVYYRPQKPGEIFQTDIFILRGSGEEEVFTPQFTYHGFQYIEVVSDRPVKLSAKNLTGLFMHTDVPQTGTFSCSNTLLNKIWEAGNQSYLSNLHSIPTDCPQREKNGWTADAHASIDLALLNFDGIAFYEKWMNDFIDNQRENGGISGIIPSSGWGYGNWPGPVWDAALFIIPDALYNYYGDTRCIENLYPTMLRYLDYLKEMEKDGILTNGIGDWVSYRAQTPTDYTSTVYYCYDYLLMARFASLLQKDPKIYLEKANLLKDTINSRFFNPETNLYANGTQTAQALALYIGIVPEDRTQQVADNLQKTVAENNHFLDFGLLGSRTVLQMLSRYGYVEDAYKMAIKTDAPSWGYWIEKQGYSTFPETWLLSPEFHDASLNHIFLGAGIGTWMYNVLAGINYDEEKPGFERIIIKPYYVSDLTWVKGQYKSVRGIVSSEWKRKGNEIELTVSIPSGSTATVFTDQRQTVGAGTHKFTFNYN
jgi:alpha-L-rhamnosidase